MDNFLNIYLISKASDFLIASQVFAEIVEIFKICNQFVNLSDVQKTRPDEKIPYREKIEKSFLNRVPPKSTRRIKRRRNTTSK